MIKTINFKLNKFNTIPNSLREVANRNSASEQTEVNLADLYNHYFQDKYGRYIPDPDPANFEYLRFITNTADFRIQGDGIGDSTVARRNSSTDLGQAFCRYFLYKHLNITYFAHMEHVLDKNTIPAFNGMVIERLSSGDVPDYLCAESVDKVFIGEAKARYTSINFSNKEFQKWRNQFNRIIIKNKNGIPISLKGYIVGTRLATEVNRMSLNTTLYVEDPKTKGEYFSGKDISNLGLRIISLHYSNIAEKINQPMLASSLFYGFTMQDEIQFPPTVWEFTEGPIKGLRFVGGYYGKDVKYDKLGNIINNAYNLMASRLTFYGVEENIFKSVVRIARGDINNTIEMPTLKQIEPFYSGVSILRDGSIIAPVEFLRPIGIQRY